MPKVTLEVPEEVAQLLKAMEAKLRQEAKAGKSFGEVDPDGTLKPSTRRPRRCSAMRSGGCFEATTSTPPVSGSQANSTPGSAGTRRRTRRGKALSK
jgi:hypothetical protein